MSTNINIAKAIVAVMQEVKGMEKNSRVGSGGNAYNGTKDQDVKEVFNEALAKNGLCILPTGIEEETQIDRWQQEETWGNKTQIKTKQSVFTKVKTKYLLLHSSGESIEIAGYGHGVDTQDKGAGKATTYALKNALLYAFLTPVGKIDDTDPTHSNDIPVPPNTKGAQPQQTTPQLPVLAEGSEDWNKVVQFLAEGKLKSVGQIQKNFLVTKEMAIKINKMIADKVASESKDQKAKVESEEAPATEKTPDAKEAPKAEEPQPATEENRLPNLTKENFEKAKKGTKVQILNVLATHRMGKIMREELEALAESMPNPAKK